MVVRGPDSTPPVHSPARRAPGQLQLTASSASALCCTPAGKGVYGFTFDPLIGEYILSHPDIKIPEKGGCPGWGHGSLL